MEITARVCASLRHNHLQVVNVLKTWPWKGRSSLPAGGRPTALVKPNIGNCKSSRVVRTVNRCYSTNAPAPIIEHNNVKDLSKYSVGLPETNPCDDLILSPNTEDISDVAPYLMPTFNFAAYVNKSQTLQELVKLGVDLHKLEKKKGIPQFILKLDFEKDMFLHLRFLNDIKVPPEQLGRFLTKNPLIFREDLDNLQVRINYLLSKRFTPDMVTSIVQHNPHWLMFSTQRIDARLGYFQKTFALSGAEVRELTTKQPRLITYNMSHIKLSTFGFKEEMGFNNEEIKLLLLGRPKLWMMDGQLVSERFHFVHTEMKIAHGQIAEQPQVLGSRVFRTKQRHDFLVHLNRAQYDPKLPGYVSLENLVTGTDAEFCSRVAKASVQTFNLFLKSL